ncbi:MAG: hypothetical protein JW755_14065 [Candidatus Aminicenantes bacterium]|nr:hypothetical protein [Candidatus Aminicenantes bacterium]
MKRSVLFLLILTLICSGSILQAQTAGWKKHVTGSFSFHYPAGWQVKQQESVVEISNPVLNEQLLIVSMPFESNKSPLQLTQDMIGLFRQTMPDLIASGFREAENTVYFQSFYSEEDLKFQAEVLVIKDVKSASWFSYSAPREGYDQAFALDLLQKFVGSIASGNSSKPPLGFPQRVKIAASPNLEKNARSFLFVLEFTLGAPFTDSQEERIVQELLLSWKNQSPQELQKFDSYPELVTAILSLGQQELEELRKELEQTIRDWLEESDPNDSVVRIVKSQLELKSKVLLEGNPPLTEMAAAAYCELLTYAELLKNSQAVSLNSLPYTRVDYYRKLLKNSWNLFSVEEKSQILTSPGLWITFRTLLRFGNDDQKEQVRLQLLKLAPEVSSELDSKDSSRPKSMIKHNVLRDIQQQTFNHYLWSRGFKSTIYGY